jgi:hypothetical protein
LLTHILFKSTIIIFGININVLFSVNSFCSFGQNNGNFLEFFSILNLTNFFILLQKICQILEITRLKKKSLIGFNWSLLALSLSIKPFLSTYSLTWAVHFIELHKMGYVITIRNHVHTNPCVYDLCSNQPFAWLLFEFFSVACGKSVL